MAANSFVKALGIRGLIGSLHLISGYQRFAAPQSAKNKEPRICEDLHGFRMQICENPRESAVKRLPDALF
jgi:hypothetical protein